MFAFYRYRLVSFLYWYISKLLKNSFSCTKFCTKDRSELLDVIVGVTLLKAKNQQEQRRIKENYFKSVARNLSLTKSLRNSLYLS